MRSPIRFLVGSLIILCLLFELAFGQTPNQKPKTPEQSDVVQLSTTVIQTDLMVFTKDGRFVSNLKQDQFELSVDGKPQPISFFDIVTAGTSKEETQLAIARGEKPQPKKSENVSRDIGRSIFFFVDDFHLSPDSLNRTRKMLQDYVNNEANSNDKVAIITTSGQLGFLQQLCDNKAVLRAAINRLAYREPRRNDPERPMMTEGQAIDIERNDRDVVNYFVDATLRENPSFKRTDRVPAEIYVRRRATTLVRSTAAVTMQSLESLELFLKDVSQLSGRKLAFYVSDGFLVQNQDANIVGKLRDVTYRAGLAGVVFYTLDARGLMVGLPDASGAMSADMTGQGSRGMSNDILDAQDGLNALAADTGGRAIRNTNAIGTSVTTALAETSQYYVLAWQWNQDDGYKDKVRRLQVKIKDHPEYVIRMPQRMLDAPRAVASNNNTATGTQNMDPNSTAAVEKQLVDILKSQYPKKNLPLSVYTSFSKSAEKSEIANISMQIPAGMIDVKESAGNLNADLSLFCLVFNDHGKEVTRFKERMAIAVPQSSGQTTVLPDLVRNQVAVLTPGLYEIRVVARDNFSGLTGAVQEWIEVPDLAAKRLALSTPFIGEYPGTDANSANASNFKELSLKLDKDFTVNSNLRFMTYIYNVGRVSSAGQAGLQTSTQSASSSQVVGEARILKNNKPVVSSPPYSISASGTNSDHLTYLSELPLKGLTPGSYTLEVTVTEGATNSKATQEINFTIR